VSIGRSARVGLGFAFRVSHRDLCGRGKCDEVRAYRRSDGEDDESLLGVRVLYMSGVAVVTIGEGNFSELRERLPPQLPDLFAGSAQLA
jgi:hypothetical protein